MRYEGIGEADVTAKWAPVSRQQQQQHQQQGAASDGPLQHVTSDDITNLL
jgi:hypothetical protein